MRIYTGQRTEAGPDVWVRDVLANGVISLAALSPRPSQAIRNHSPTGFEWGYGGSGPAQLALALLYHHTGSRYAAERWHQDFKWAIVANWLGDAWSLTADELDTWLRSVGAEIEVEVDVVDESAEGGDA